MVDIPQESLDRIMNNFDTTIRAMFAQSTSGTDFQSKVEENTSNSRIEREPDGVAANEAPDAKRSEHIDLYQKFLDASSEAEEDNYLRQLAALESQYPELADMDAINEIISKSPNAYKKMYKKAAFDIAANQAHADSIYYKTTEDKKAATAQKFAQVFDNVSTFFKEKCQKAAQKDLGEPSPVTYTKNSCKSGGKTFKYETIHQSVNWGSLIASKSKSKERNLEQLRTLVSKEIGNIYGGFGNITSIIVRSNQLIINNMCYSPQIDASVLTDDSIFPADSLDYIKAGCIAPLFNWKHLRSMRKLELLDIDDANFYLTTVASDIGAGRRAGISTIFNIVKSLQIFILNDYAVKRDEQDTPKGRILKEKLAVHKHFINKTDAVTFSIYGCTGGLQNWTWNNLLEYAGSRGNKGLLRFSTGMLVRTAATGLAGVINISAHLIGSIYQVVKQVKDNK